MVASFASTFLSYLDVLIWPAVVLVGLAYVAHRWGEKIGPLIDRINMVKVPGFQAGFDQAPQHPQPQAAEGSADDTAESAELDVLIDALEVHYEQQLQEHQVAAEQQRDDLLRQLALANLLLEFERVHRVIYGSQIAAMRALRAVDAPLPRSVLETHLAQSKATWTLTTFIQSLTFEQWIAWPMNQGLLEPTGSAVAVPAVAAALGQELAYALTVKGAAYLAYIDAQGLPARIY